MIGFRDQAHKEFLEEAMGTVDSKAINKELAIIDANLGGKGRFPAKHIVMNGMHFYNIGKDSSGDGIWSLVLWRPNTIHPPRSSQSLEPKT